MWMFQKAEHFNREIAFKAAYDLAKENINTPFLVELQVNKFSEIMDIKTSRNISYEAAVATMAGREALDRTQFVYQSWARPQFLRGPAASSLLVFFSYTANMLYAMGNNPGAKQMLLISLALYGMMGLPGAGDLDWILRALARKFIGKDFSPQMEARKYLRHLTEGTMFDEVGPDLALHGISRFSFGPGLLADGWGAPRFDASANGSLGRIIPGLQAGVRTWSNGGDWKEFSADVASDMAGAGFGQMFTLLKFMGADPFSADGKKWEMLYPRAVKGMSKAYRYIRDGKEVTRSGATFAPFNLNDPDDKATIVTQFMGFTPVKVSAKWEALRSVQDTLAFYDSRKKILMIDMDTAVRSKDPAVVQDVVRRITEFNSELDKVNFQSLGITGKGLRDSLKARTRSRVMEENNLPAKKTQIPVQDSVFDLYPQVDSRKVK